MMRIRVTYPGAFHHVMNSGYDDKNIFPEVNDKNRFFELLMDLISAKFMVERDMYFNRDLNLL